MCAWAWNLPAPVSKNIVLKFVPKIARLDARETAQRQAKSINDRTETGQTGLNRPLASTCAKPNEFRRALPRNSS
jgi:hypothetical protein